MKIKLLLKHHLTLLNEIDDLKSQLKTVSESAATLPGVGKRAFTSLGNALHQLPGDIDDKLENVEQLINSAFSKADDNLDLEL